jgi:hypothetical protein
LEHSPAQRARHCRRCQASAVSPPLLTVDRHHQPRDWFLCEHCWLLLALGFRDQRPNDDLIHSLTPLEGRPDDSEVYLYVLRGAVIFERLERLVL